MKIRFQILTLFLLCFLLGNGCNKQKLPADLPRLYPCKITIKDKEGNPMPTVIVSVNPEDKGNRWGASGETNASGVAEIFTASLYRRLSSGKYRVTLTRLEHTKTGRFDDTGTEIVESKNLIPDEYVHSAQTPFLFEMGTKAVTETFHLEK